MSGWRFADRGWFHNDGLNLCSEANRRLVADELVGRNVVFGSHRWFTGGAAPSHVAMTTIDQWDAELARGRPGDNLILLSLRRVAHLALVHADDLSTPQPAALGPEDVAAIEGYDAAARLGELLFVRRFVPRPGGLEAALDTIDLRDAGEPWRERVAEASAGGGEIWLFDGELAWRDHERRQYGTEPPETWTAHHGIYLVDGYVPDGQGRVVCGGPY